DNLADGLNQAAVLDDVGLQEMQARGPRQHTDSKADENRMRRPTRERQVGFSVVLPAHRCPPRDPTATKAGYADPGSDRGWSSHPRTDAERPHARGWVTDRPMRSGTPRAPGFRRVRTRQE